MKVVAAMKMKCAVVATLISLAKPACDRNGRAQGSISSRLRAFRRHQLYSRHGLAAGL